MKKIVLGLFVIGLFVLTIFVLTIQEANKKRLTPTPQKQTGTTQEQTLPKKTSPSTSSKETKVSKELSYLNDIPEIAWWEIDDNNVYIGFSPVPDDWDLIVRGAALRGNQATDFGFHAWGVRGDQRGWRPGSGPYLGEHTARYGRVAD